MPNRFVPLGAGTDLPQAISAINNNFAQLDNETVTKAYRQPGGNAIIEGKLPYEGGYGALYYDSDNVPRIVIGILPDGTMGIVISKEGVDVIDWFS